MCACGMSAHYEGHHYPDTSQPGMYVTWCICGGSGKFHHVSITPNASTGEAKGEDDNG